MGEDKMLAPELYSQILAPVKIFRLYILPSVLPIKTEKEVSILTAGEEIKAPPVPGLNCQILLPSSLSKQYTFPSLLPKITVVSKSTAEEYTAPLVGDIHSSVSAIIS